MDRVEIESNLGRKMHQVCLQQEVVKNENEKLQALRSEANALDKQLTELDNGERDNT